MKQIFCVIFFFVFLLTGCAAEVAPQAPNEPNFLFCSAFSADYGDFSFGGIWDSTAPGIYTVTLHYPDTLAGTVYSCNGENVTISFENQVQTIPLAAIPEQGALRILFGVFKGCSVQPVFDKPTRSGEYWSFTGTGSNSGLVLQTDSLGTIREITLDYKNLTIRFLEDESESE